MPGTNKSVLFRAVTSRAGFTLIELIMVIVILGTLAAIAFPRFIDLSAEAEDTALQGIAASMGSASAMNYAVRLASDRAKGLPVADCQDVAGLMDGGIPGGYSVTAQVVAPGATGSCTVTQASSSQQAGFVIHGTT